MFNHPNVQGIEIMQEIFDIIGGTSICDNIPVERKTKLLQSIKENVNYENR